MAEVHKTPQTPRTDSGVTDINELQSNLAVSGVTDASDERQHTRASVQEVAGDWKARAGATGKVEQTWDDARRRARMFQEDSKQYVRQNPTKAVLMALGIGFVLGLSCRR